MDDPSGMESDAAEGARLAEPKPRDPTAALLKVVESVNMAFLLFLLVICAFLAF
jgi:hypothetical protein